MRTNPDYIQFYPTLRCNRSCGFCFNRSLSPLADMSLDACNTMFKRLRKADVQVIDIMGGEPTMHGDIVQMIQAAGALGFKVNISTNGTDPGTLGQLFDQGQEVMVGISINDNETIGPLADLIRKHRPVVKSLFQPNMDLGMVRDILLLGPEKYYLLYPDVLEPDKLDTSVPFDRFMSLVQKQFHASQVGTVYCSGFLPETTQYPELSSVRCPAGTTKLGILPDGSVYPCNLFFSLPEFRLGNILSDPFDVIWQHPKLSFFRAFDRNRCPRSTCEHHAACHGGCPAHAFLLSGDLAGPDPRCCSS